MFKGMFKKTTKSTKEIEQQVCSVLKGTSCAVHVVPFFFFFFLILLILTRAEMIC